MTVTKSVVDEVVRTYLDLRRRVRLDPVVEFRGQTEMDHRCKDGSIDCVSWYAYLFD